MAGMIQVQKLVKNFGSLFALRGVDLTVKKGSVLCVLGPNGAGKSTLLSICATLARPTSGSVLIDDLDVQKKADFGALQRCFRDCR